MNMKLKKVLDDIQKTEEKIAELQKHLKKQNDLKQQMEDIEIIKSFRSLKLDSRELLVLLDGIQKGTATIRLDEEGGIAIEDAGEKKDGNKENNKGSDVQIPETTTETTPAVEKETEETTQKNTGGADIWKLCTIVLAGGLGIGAVVVYLKYGRKKEDGFVSEQLEFTDGPFINEEQENEDGQEE